MLWVSCEGLVLKGTPQGSRHERSSPWREGGSKSRLRLLPEDTNHHFPKGGSSGSRNSWDPSPPSFLSLLPGYIFSITLVTILILYTQNSWGQGFIFYAHYCISPVLEQCLCLLVPQWIYEECWCRWQTRAPSSLLSMPAVSRWVPVLVWAIQSHWDSHICTGLYTTGIA